MPRITPYAIAAALSVVAAANCLPVQAASPPIAGAAADTISFEQYRDWRLHFIEERQTQIEAELAATDLSAPRHAALLRQKAYYDFFATMKAAERDRRFRERFDEIDANHDGIIDGGERAAWYDKQRAFYERSPYRHEAANEGSRR
jgi:hypothetical protein